MIEIKTFDTHGQLDEFCIDNLSREQIINIQRNVNIMPITGKVAISFTVIYFE